MKNKIICILAKRINLLKMCKPFMENQFIFLLNVIREELYRLKFI